MGVASLQALMSAGGPYTLRNSVPRPTLLLQSQLKNNFCEEIRLAPPTLNSVRNQKIKPHRIAWCFRSFSVFSRSDISSSSLVWKSSRHYRTQQIRTKTLCNLIDAISNKSNNLWREEPIILNIHLSDNLTFLFHKAVLWNSVINFEPCWTLKTTLIQLSSYVQFYNCDDWRSPNQIA